MLSIVSFCFPLKISNVGSYKSLTSRNYVTISSHKIKIYKYKKCVHKIMHIQYASTQYTKILMYWHSWTYTKFTHIETHTYTHAKEHMNKHSQKHIDTYTNITHIQAPTNAHIYLHMHMRKHTQTHAHTEITIVSQAKKYHWQISFSEITWYLYCWKIRIKNFNVEFVFFFFFLSFIVYYLLLILCLFLLLTTLSGHEQFKVK